MLETMHISERISQVWNELTRQNSRPQLTAARHPAPGSIRVHYGWYVSREFWQSLRPEDQHLTRMIAIHRAAKSQPVFSHLSAAVLLGIPVHADLRKAAHITTGSKGSCRPSKGLIRHARPLTALETVNVHGLRCTSPERTLLDLWAASLWVVEFLVTMQESVTASLGRLKTGEHHPLDAGVEEFHRVLAEVATIR